MPSLSRSSPSSGAYPRARSSPPVASPDASSAMQRHGGVAVWRERTTAACRPARSLSPARTSRGTRTSGRSSGRRRPGRALARRRARAAAWRRALTMGGAPRFPSTVGRVLERSARRMPERLALTFAERRWSYAELDRGGGPRRGRAARPRAQARRPRRRVRQELRRLSAAVPRLRALPGSCTCR